MARVIMVRHGETDWSREARWQGHSDVPLNALGFEQADRLVKPLAKQQPTHIVTSDLVRTQQTIRPLAELLGLPITTDADLREIDVGSWAGLTHDEAAARDPEGALRHDEGGTGWTDGEGYADVAERGTRALNRHSEGLSESDLLVIVAHGGLIGAVTGRIIGLTAEQQRVHLGRISHGHATYLRRRESAAGPIWRVLAYNAPLLGDAGPPIELTSH